MHTTKQTLISFFNQVAQKNKIQLENIKQEPCFELEQERWCFTLPNLHSFLQRQNNVFSYIDYKKFRQLIYSTPINQSVKVYDAEIIIIDNQGKVDKSTYALVWQAKEKPTS
jgi:hypothetical protein